MLGFTTPGTFYPAGDDGEGSTGPPVVSYRLSALGPVEQGGGPGAYRLSALGPVQAAQGAYRLSALQVGQGVFVRQRRAGVLGCGSYAVAIEARGGSEELMRLSYSALGFSRVYCGTGEIRVSVDGITECTADCANLQALAAWRHEIVILRDSVEVARGPLITPEVQGDHAELLGGDMSAWLSHRVLHELVTPIEAMEATSLAVAIVYDAMIPDPSPGLTGVFKAPTGVLVAPELVPFNQYSADALNGLADDGVAWTTIGREVFIGPVNLFGDNPVATLRTGDMDGSPKVTGNGNEQANSWHVQPDQQVAEAGAEGQPAVLVVGHYTDLLAAFEDGLLERIGRSPGVVGQAPADLVAFRNTQITRNTPRAIDEATLGRDANVTLDQLVPGHVFTVEDPSCVPFAENVRLVGVNVDATPSEDTVKVSFDPVLAGPSG